MEYGIMPALDPEGGSSVKKLGLSFWYPDTQTGIMKLNTPCVYSLLAENESSNDEPTDVDEFVSVMLASICQREKRIVIGMQPTVIPILKREVVFITNISWVPDPAGPESSCPLRGCTCGLVYRAFDVDGWVVAGGFRLIRQSPAACCSFFFMVQ